MRTTSTAPALALGLTLASAALLRFWALGHGVPFGIGVDEPEVMDRAVRMMKTGDFNPHFYDYPAFYIYVQAAVAAVRFVMGAIRGQWSALSQASTEDFYLWGRAVTAALGTASVWLLYRAGLRWDRTTAVLGAALLAVMPLHVRESHYVLTDVPMTCFVTLTLVLSLRAYERRDIWSFILAGAAVGIAGATKYPGILGIVLPVLAGIGAPRGRHSRSALIGASFAAALAAFLLAAPYSLLDLPNFLNGFAYLSSQYRTPLARTEPVSVIALKNLRNGLDWRGTWPLAALPIGIGSLLAVGGVLLGILRMTAGRPARTPWALATVFPVLYFWFVARQNIHFARYLLPVVPFLSLLTAALVVRIAINVFAHTIPNPIRTAIVTLLVASVILPPLFTAVGFDVETSRVWTTEEAYDWVLQSIPRGSTVRLEGRALLLPAEYHPTYAKQLSFETVAADAAHGVDYLVASSEEYGRYVADPTHYPAECASYQQIFSQTQELARFTPSKSHPGPELRILKVPR